MKKYINKITRHIRIPKVKLPFKKIPREKPYNKQKTMVTGIVLILVTSILTYLFVINTYITSDEYSEPFRVWLTTSNGKIFIASYLSILFIFILLSIKRTRTYITKCVDRIGHKLPRPRIGLPSTPLLTKIRSRFAFRYSPVQTQKRKKRIIYLVWVILLLTPLVVYTFINQTQAEAGWWNDNWQYRQKVVISNSGSAQTDFQVPITINTATLISAGKMQSDCDDIRILDSTGNQILDPWLVTTCNDSVTRIWVKFSTVPTYDVLLYVYYGHGSAISVQSSGSDVFPYFDDFTSISSDWNQDSGTWSAETFSSLSTVSIETAADNQYL